MGKTKGTPLISALKRYISDGTVRFHMPGHKGGQAIPDYLVKFLGNRVFAADVTNVPGLDDLHQSRGVIREAQELAAETFGADRTYFLVNGSSCGLQALVMAACGPGERILAPRNIHRSILSGIILSGAVPVFFTPEYDCEYKIPLGACPEKIALCLDQNPGVKAVLLVTPTYHGITSDVASIAEIAHGRGIPLLVDEAHGPHLSFHGDLPPSALEGGADASVQGTHKILSAFTQASMLHLKSRLIERQRLEAALKLLQSTSTSYLLLASLDAAREQAAACGRYYIQGALDLAGYLRNEINQIKPLSSFGAEITGRPGVHGFDPAKVTISVRRLGVTGLWAEQWLREKYKIQVEMSDLLNLLLIVTFGNLRFDADLLLEALRDMVECVKLNLAGAFPRQIAPDPLPGIPDLVITPREAFWAPVAAVSLPEAAGRVSAETIACYPPGIPVICPGERITGEIVDYLAGLRSVGMHFQGCYDTGLETVMVVK